MKRNLYEKKCPICGKIFTVTNAEWVYKGRDKDEEGVNRQIYYCSWTCYRKSGKGEK